MAGDDDILDSSDGLTDAERAQFNEMQSATSGDAPVADQGAAAADGAAEAGAADAGADAGKAAIVDAGAAKETPAADAATDDDDESADEPVLGADGKPVVGADGQPRRRKARVSANKYNTEKARADKLAADVQERDLKLTRYDERMRLLTEALTTPKADAKKDEPEADIDLEADVFGGINQIRTQTRKEIADLKAAISEIREGKQTEDGQRAVKDTYEKDAIDFAGKNPGFWDAYQHLRASRVQELALFHFGIDLTAENAPQLTEQQANRIANDFNAEERGIAENAISQRRSPAQAVYQMARYRGYTPRQAAAASNGATNGANGHANGANGAANGKAPVNGGGAAANGKANVSEEIARIKAGTEASVSLSDGGASPSNPMTPQKLADMPEAEFNALMDRLDPEEIRVLFEGRA